MKEPKFACICVHDLTGLDVLLIEHLAPLLNCIELLQVIKGEVVLVSFVFASIVHLLVVSDYKNHFSLILEGLDALNLLVQHVHAEGILVELRCGFTLLALIERCVHRVFGFCVLAVGREDLLVSLDRTDIVSAA